MTGHRIHVETLNGARVESRTTCSCGFVGEWVPVRVQAWQQADAHVEAHR